MENRILSHQQVQYKIRRIAYQIYEAHVEEPEIVLAGIKGGGLEFAKKIKRVLEQITPAKVVLCRDAAGLKTHDYLWVLKWARVRH